MVQCRSFTAVCGCRGIVGNARAAFPRRYARLGYSSAPPRYGARRNLSIHRNHGPHFTPLLNSSTSFSSSSWRFETRSGEESEPKAVLGEESSSNRGDGPLATAAQANRETTSNTHKSVTGEDAATSPISNAETRQDSQPTIVRRVGTGVRIHPDEPAIFRKLGSATPIYPLDIPQRKPYSIPQPELFNNVPPGQVKYRLRGKHEEEIPMAAWYADRAGPPLLLTLDAFDTLYTPKEPIPRQYAATARRFGYEVSEEQVKIHFKKAFKAVSADYPLQGHGKIHYREWWAKVIEQTFEPFKLFRRPWPDPDLTARLYENFSSSRGYTLFADVEPFLSMIGTCWQARDWPPRRTMLGILSNSDPRVYEILQAFNMPIQQQDSLALYPPRYAPDHRNHDPQFGPATFSFATVSYECGFEKPDERIYDQAVVGAQSVLDSLDPVARLTRSGRHLLTSVDEEFQFMHIGDSVEKDVMPAIRRGWDAVLLDRSAPDAVAERRVDELDRSVTVINSLMSLPSVVTKERLQTGLDARHGRHTGVSQNNVEASDPLDRLFETKRANKKTPALSKAEPVERR